MGLDINLNTSKIDISEDDGLNVDLYGDNVSISEDDSDDIIIEITGLKSINKFIGLEDTPLYYDNGKFFKVENNKIIYTDIEWGDISGDLNDAPEIIALIQKLIEKTTDTIVNNYIHLHNINQEAHPYIQNIIQDNYNILNRKIDNSQEELFQDITSLTGALDNEIEERQAADSLLSENLQEETLARIDAQTSLHNDISNLNTLLEDEVTARTEGDSLLENSLGALTDELLQEISNRQTQDNALQGQITSNFNILNEKINTESNDRVESDTLLQNNIDTLTNNVNSLSTTVSNNYTTLDNKINSTKTELEGDIDTLSTTVTNNYNDLSGSIASNTQAISTETTNRQNADNNLQSQIDAITASSDVTDIVGTYAQLQAYDTSTLPPNSIIKVLQDEHQNDETTYYRWVITGGVGAWVLIGEEGPYYTKSEADGRFVPQTRTINGKALSNNISLTATDVNALPNTTVIGDGILSVQKNGTTIDTFSANATENKSINITVPTDTSDLTNNAGFITSEDLPMVNNGTLTIQVNGSPVGTFTANQSGNTTANIVVPDSATWGNITGDITNQTDLQDALNAKQDTLTAGTDLEIIQGTSVKLPEGFTQLEYIQFTGTQYINTGILGNAGIETDVTFSFDEVPRDNSVLASRVGQTRIYPIHIFSGWCLGYGSYYSKANIFVVDVVYNVVTALKAGQQTMTVNNHLAINRSDDTVYNTDIPMYLGAQANASSAGGTITAQGFVKIKLYRIKIKSNGVLVLDGVPCDNNGTIGLYDLVSETLLTNQGTGSFVAGAEVPSSTVINFTNETGYITGINSTDVTTALGYTPYNATNPNGYTSNIGTVTSVNNTQPDANGNVTISTGGTVDQTYDGTSTNAQSGVAIAGAGFLQNISSNANSISVLGTATGNSYSINIGKNSSVSNNNCIAIGYGAQSQGNYALGFGYYARAKAQNAIQLGYGTNNTTDSLQIGSYQLLDTSTGLIPDARLSSNIARTSQIPTVPTNISAFTNDSGYITSSALSGYATETWVGQQGYITGIGSTDVTTALGYTPYNSSNPNGYTSNVGTVTSVNNTEPDTNGNVNISIPSAVTESTVAGWGFTKNAGTVTSVNNIQPVNGNVTIDISDSVIWGNITGDIIDQTDLKDILDDKQDVLTAQDGITLTNNVISGSILQEEISSINNLIPAQATVQNQLADKAFVNSSISSNTSNFIGTFNSVSELESYTGVLTNNDYAFVSTTDSAGNTLYDRYKWNGSEWLFEYELNNSSFTASQWNSINSGITSNDVTLISTAIQPNDNISSLTNDTGFITSASLPTVNDSSISIQKNGVGIGSFTLNQSSNKTINISIPTDTSDLTNGAGFITGITNTDITTALGYTPYNSSNPNGYTSNTGTVTSVNNIQPVNGNVTIAMPTVPTDISSFNNDSGYITSSALNGYATENWVEEQGYITGISSSDVTTALGYTPYNSSNPNGYTSNVGTVTSVNNIQPVNGNVTLSIPSVGNGTVTFTQGGVTKGSITMNQSGNTTIDFDAGSSGGIQNTATGTNSLTILGTPTTFSYAMNIGLYSNVTEDDSIAIGQGARVSGADSLGIGRDCNVSGDNSIQLGNGTLIDDNIFQVWNYPLLDYQYGKIFEDRIPTTIARTSQIPSAVTESTVSGWGFTKNTGTVTSVNNVQPVNGNVTIAIPTVPTNVSAFTNDSGYITEITSSDVTTALGYTPYNSTNPNGYITSSALNGYATQAWVGQQGYLTSSSISNMQTTGNLVTSISSSSTDSQYPSAKCMYDIIGDIETLLQAV